VYELYRLVGAEDELTNRNRAARFPTASVTCWALAEMAKAQAGIESDGPDEAERS
jgi:hypothetical protein